jgi:hypothetical protein
MRDDDVSPIGRIKFHDGREIEFAPGAGQPSSIRGLDEADRRVFTPPNPLVTGGSAATSGPTSAGNGCARYLRQQARDREDARLRDQARRNNQWATPKSPGAHSRKSAISRLTHP